MSDADAYMEGYEAFDEGADQSECPYSYDSPAGQAWMAGYQAAEDADLEEWAEEDDGL